MNDNNETPEEKERRDELTKAAIAHEARQRKKEKGVRDNHQQNSDEAISKRNDFDVHDE